MNNRKWTREKLFEVFAPMQEVMEHRIATGMWRSIEVEQLFADGYSSALGLLRYNLCLKCYTHIGYRRTPNDVWWPMPDAYFDGIIGVAEANEDYERAATVFSYRNAGIVPMDEVPTNFLQP